MQATELVAVRLLRRAVSPGWIEARFYSQLQILRVRQTSLLEPKAKHITYAPDVLDM